MTTRNPEVVRRYVLKYAKSKKRKVVFEKYVGISDNSELKGTIGLRPRAWVKEEIELLKDVTKTTRDLAIALGRSYYSVQHKRAKVKNDRS